MHSMYLHIASPQRRHSAKFVTNGRQLFFSSISSKCIKYMPIYCFYTTLGGIGRYREIRRLFARSCMLYHI